MKDDERKALAAHVAKWIFELGRNYTALPMSRIQFMHGKYPKGEKPGGGLCEGALADHIEMAIESFDCAALTKVKP